MVASKSRDSVAESRASPLPWLGIRISTYSDSLLTVELDCPFDGTRLDLELGDERRFGRKEGGGNLHPLVI